MPFFNLKHLSPQFVARLIAASVTLFLLILLSVLLAAGYMSLPLWVLAVVVAATGILTWFVAQYFINHFIYRKIKLIYKTIYTTKLGTEEKKAMARIHRGSVENIEQEVLEWKQRHHEETSKQSRLEQFRKEFLGNVFHELKTPIFNIQGYLETLIEGGMEDPEIRDKFLMRARKNVRRMTEIVDDLQMIANLEDRSFSVTPERFDITRLIHEVMESHEIRAAKKKIRLGFKQGCDKPFDVIADRELIHQVVSNLISNSIKYGNEEGKTLIGLYDMGEKILVEVADNGIGIGEEDLPRIFERFYRVDKARSRKMGGSGLGLSIVKHIIEAHHQVINVRSTPGIGTTFGFTLQKAG
ncbi:MAG: ATP-binding protein [Bacteroidales bacterium]